MRLRVSHLANLAVAGVLAGNEFATWAVVHRAVAERPVPEQIAMEQAITRRYLPIMPLLMTGAVASGIPVVAAARGSEDPAAIRLTLAGTGCIGVILALTLAGNMPVNLATLRATPDTDPDTWRRLRRRWNRLHSARVALDVTGFVLLLAGALRDAQSDPS